MSNNVWRGLRHSGHPLNRLSVKWFSSTKDPALSKHLASYTTRKPGLTLSHATGHDDFCPRELAKGGKREQKQRSPRDPFTVCNPTLSSPVEHP